MTPEGNGTSYTYVKVKFYTQLLLRIEIKKISRKNNILDTFHLFIFKEQKSVIFLLLNKSSLTFAKILLQYSIKTYFYYNYL